MKLTDYPLNAHLPGAVPREVMTIQPIADSCDISKNHLMKIILRLGQALTVFLAVRDEPTLADVIGNAAQIWPFVARGEAKVRRQ